MKHVPTLVLAANLIAPQLCTTANAQIGETSNIDKCPAETRARIKHWTSECRNVRNGLALPQPPIATVMPNKTYRQCSGASAYYLQAWLLYARSQNCLAQVLCFVVGPSCIGWRSFYDPGPGHQPTGIDRDGLNFAECGEDATATSSNPIWPTCVVK